MHVLHIKDPEVLQYTDGPYRTWPRRFYFLPVTHLCTPLHLCSMEHSLGSAGVLYFTRSEPTENYRAHLGGPPYSRKH